MSGVPSGDWFCQTCKPATTAAEDAAPATDPAPAPAPADADAGATAETAQAAAPVGLCTLNQVDT
jgi:hypothetical protein